MLGQTLLHFNVAGRQGEPWKGFRMTFLIALIGATIAGLGIMGFVRPRGLLGFFESILESRTGLYWAIGIRVVSGLLLLATASESRFPQAFRVLGVIALVAAALAPLLGFARLRRFVRWWTDRSPSVVRVWSLVTVGFGSFLVYAVW
jgi:hypothetical protein